jgi:hypothetical protein
MIVTGDHAPLLHAITILDGSATGPIRNWRCSPR